MRNAPLIFLELADQQGDCCIRSDDIQSFWTDAKSGLTTVMQAYAKGTFKTKMTVRDLRDHIVAVEREFADEQHRRDCERLRAGATRQVEHVQEPTTVSATPRRDWLHGDSVMLDTCEALSVRARNALHLNGIATFGDLRRLTNRDLRQLSRVGDLVAHEINHARWCISADATTEPA